MHDSSEGGFKHHGNTGADGYNDHDPVQVSHQSQQITAKSKQNWETLPKKPPVKPVKEQRRCFYDSNNVKGTFLMNHQFSIS